MKNITAIPTIYKNRTFRSRLEVKWAVYFDAMGIKWDYEPEGFRLQDGSYYLPDFWLPESNWYVEVKPMGFKSDSRHDLFSSELRLMVLVGPPTEKEYYVISGTDKITKRHKSGPEREYALKIVEYTNLERPVVPATFLKHLEERDAYDIKMFPIVERFENGEDISSEKLLQTKYLAWGRKCPRCGCYTAFDRKLDTSVLCLSCCRVHKNEYL